MIGKVEKEGADMSKAMSKRLMESKDLTMAEKKEILKSVGDKKKLLGDLKKMAGDEPKPKKEKKEAKPEPKPKRKKKLNIDWELHDQSIAKCLEFAFDDPENILKGLSHPEIDALAQKILLRYLRMDDESKKESGD